MDIVARVRTIAETPDIPTNLRVPLIQVLENHQHYLSTRKTYPGLSGRSETAHGWARPLSGTLQRIGKNELTGVSAYSDWRQKAERLTAAGEAILSGKETYSVHLERLVTAKNHMTRTLSALREVIRVDDKELAEREARELRRLQNRHWLVPGSQRMTATRRTGPEPYFPAPGLRGWRSPASAGPSVISSAGRATTIGGGPRPSRARPWRARRC